MLGMYFIPHISDDVTTESWSINISFVTSFDTSRLSSISKITGNVKEQAQGIRAISPWKASVLGHSAHHSQDQSTEPQCSIHSQVLRKYG